jgi:hypothetical protein
VASICQIAQTNSPKYFRNYHSAVNIPFPELTPISAVLGTRFFFENGRLYWFRPIEKGGKYHKVPVYHMRIANR